MKQQRFAIPRESGADWEVHRRERKYTSIRPKKMPPAFSRAAPAAAVITTSQDALCGDYRSYDVTFHIAVIRFVNGGVVPVPGADRAGVGRKIEYVCRTTCEFLSSNLSLLTGTDEVSNS
ncbi:MAG: hypothetical protein JXD23_07520 [Spirochaetales bacterium]|nr:hypothetical protein [Spirochaetales bacterium]